MKTGEDEPVGRRGALELGVQELELEQQPASQKRRTEMQEAPPDPEERTREAPPDPVEDTREAPPDPAGGDTGGAIGLQGRDARRATESREGEVGGAIGP